MSRKAVAIILMMLGAAIIVGVILFALDSVTSTEPDGLGTWIFTVLGLLLGASTGLKGWLDWNKKDVPSQTTTVTAENNSIAVGNITVGGSIGGSLVIGIPVPTGEKAPSSLHQLPPPPADFTGREELVTQLLEDFKTHKGATITGLTGMGGIGKTALGLVVAHQLKDDYPDAQLFLDLKGTTAPLSAVEIVRHVLLSMEPNMDVRGLSQENMRGAYLSMLHGKRVLLFLDNARSAEQVTPLAPPETCALLVTSRWDFRVPGLHTHHLDVMNKEDAEKFLLELCPRIGENAAELAEGCAYLPLALRIAGSFLEVNDHWQVKQYLERLNDHTKRLPTLEESRQQVDLSNQDHPNVRAAFDLSYNQLSEEEQKRWRTLGVFPTSFDAQAAQAMWGMDEEPALKLLGLLLRYSLLDYNQTASRYSLHDLLADYACSQMDAEEENQARLNHATHYKDVLSAADDLYLEGGENILPALRLFDQEWENIRAGQAWVSATPGNDRALAKLCTEYPDAGVYVLSLRQHPREKVRWLEAAVSSARETGDRRGEGNALGNLGLAYAALGETRKAIEYYEQRMVIAREIGDRRGEGNALGNLGNAYADLGETRKAIEYYEQQLVIAREIGDRRSEGAALGNLGVAYKDLGDARKAIEYYEQQLVIVREIGNQRGEGIALGNLGSAYADMGETRKAIQYYEHALVIDREIGDRQGEALDNWNLGLAYKEVGELEKAVNAMQVCVDFEREIGHLDAEKDAAKVEELRKTLN